MEFMNVNNMAALYCSATR